MVLTVVIYTALKGIIYMILTAVSDMTHTGMSEDDERTFVAH